MRLSTDKNLVRISKRVMEECVGLRKGERVCIVTNPVNDVFKISQSLYTATNELGGKPVLIIQNTKDSSDFAEDAVYQALRAAPDIVISMSEKKMGRDSIGMKSGYPLRGNTITSYLDFLRETKQTRGFWSPGVTLEMWETLVDIDYVAMRENIKKLYDILSDAINVNMSSPSGTDFTVDLGRWKPRRGDGNFTEWGVGGNIPCGELYISPNPLTGSGRIVFDGSLSYYGQELSSELQPPGETVELEVSSGVVLLESIAGGSCAPKLKSSLEKALADAKKLGKTQDYIRNTVNIGEFALGMNQNARMLGKMLSDEKVYGTAHVAIGMNYDHQGKAEDGDAINHLDCLVTKPTVTLTFKEGTESFKQHGKSYEIMQDGNLVGV